MRHKINELKRELGIYSKDDAKAAGALGGCGCLIIMLPAIIYGGIALAVVGVVLLLLKLFGIV